jgi:hypothetical protein
MQSPMKTIESSIVRIYFKDSSTACGCGFLFEDRRIMTAAHVVTSALDISHNTKGVPTDSFRIDFPLLGPKHTPVQAKVILWLPTNTENGDDIAVLELEG